VIALAAMSLFVLPTGSWSHRENPTHTVELAIGEHTIELRWAEHSRDASTLWVRGKYRVTAVKNGEYHARFLVEAVGRSGHRGGKLETVSILGATFAPKLEVPLVIRLEPEHKIDLTVFDGTTVLWSRALEPEN
jgi:hypothetical protein